MKNSYRTEGNVVHIILNRRNKPDIETIVDLNDFLDILDTMDVRWYANLDKSGSHYVKANTSGGRNILLHRVIMGELANGGVIDHKNRNTLDNTRDNLRVVSRSANNQNRKVRSDNVTGIRGVSLRNGRYQVRINHKGIRKHIGYYDTLEDAEKASIDALRKYQPDSLL